MITAYRKHLISIVLLLAAVAGLLVFVARENINEFRSNHIALAQNTVQHTNTLFLLYLHDLRRAVTHSAEHNRALIQALAANPDDRSRYNALSSELKSWFPDAFSVTIADGTGQVLLEDYEHFVGEDCRENIRLFAIDSSRSDASLHIHSDKQDYHFDIMHDMFMDDGQIIIFFVTFKPDMLANYLVHMEQPGHGLYLLKRNTRGLIEISANGTRVKLDRDHNLSSEELARILYEQDISETLWRLVDVVDEGLFQNEQINIVSESLIIFMAFIFAGLVSIRILSIHEMKRQLAENKLEDYQHELENRIIERTAELTKTNKQLEKMSLSDGLTGIANRRQFDLVLARELKRSVRDNLPLTLLMFDIDLFKRYNDAAGHLSGDDCLKKIATAVNKEFQRGSDLVARYGGEEFTVILPGSEKKDNKLLAERVRKIVWDLKILHPDSDVAERVTVSVGAACVQLNQFKTMDELIDEADAALYTAKNDGRNRVAVSPS